MREEKRREEEDANDDDNNDDDEVIKNKTKQQQNNNNIRTCLMTKWYPITIERTLSALYHGNYKTSNDFG
jgi:hypothetical protein